jgi:3-hydroxyisobutyrate dehydrogenase-like beta-hydroxyacid dehydrogenase
MQVGFVGVGAMGLAMAGHVRRGGHPVIAADTDPAALDRARQAGLGIGDLAAVAGAEAIVVMVATEPQIRAVVAGLLDAGAGGVIAIAATCHPALLPELAATLPAGGPTLVDAPVCYGMQGALKGDLISLCGGEAAAIERIRPVLMCYSRSVEHLGPAGAGQIGKTCNNLLHWAACVANYEALALARACGLDAQEMRQTLLKCPARNTTLERWDTTRFTWHEKDMDAALDLAQSRGLALPLAGLVDQLVKRLGPDDVRELLHGTGASYLGQSIAGAAARSTWGNGVPLTGNPATPNLASAAVPESDHD